MNKRIILSGHAFVSAPSERGNVVVFFWSSIFFVGSCLPLMVFFVLLIRHLRCTLPNAGMIFSGRAFSVTTFTRRYVFLVEYVFCSRLLPVDFFLILARHFRWTLLKVVVFFCWHIFAAGHSKDYVYLVTH